MMKKNSKAILLIFAICIFVPFSLTAKVPDVLSIPDSSEIRKNTLESWLLAPKSELTAKESQNLITSYGQVFQIKSEVTESEIIISIAPRKEDYFFPGMGRGAG